MNRIMNFVMLSCKENTELIEKNAVVPLSFVEKIKHKLHNSVCSVCRSYEKQSELIDKAIKDNYRGKMTSEHLSTQKKEEIIKAIEK